MAPQVLLLKGLVLTLGIFFENLVNLPIEVDCLQVLEDEDVCYSDSTIFLEITSTYLKYKKPIQLPKGKLYRLCLSEME